MIKINDYTFASKGEIEKILNFTLGRLGVKDASVAVYYSGTTLDRVSSGGVIYDALLHKTPIDHTYCLYLRKNSSVSLLSLLCHESVHIEQHERGDLVYDFDTNKYRWKGVEYKPSFPYNERPWEKEAFKTESSLWKAYKDANKQENPSKRCFKNLFNRKK